MLSDENLKSLLEGIIYIAPEPVTVDGMLKVLEGEERERVKARLDELVADYEQNTHGIQIRQVANGYKFSTKAEHHEILRKYVKSLKPPIRLSKPALETLAVIAYRQPVTMPEIEEIRGVDSGGVIHTLLEKKLVATSGRKSVVGRPILYRTSKDFLVHFGLKDIGELPSLKEFEELAKRALGSEWTPEETGMESGSPAPTLTATPESAGADAPPDLAQQTSLEINQENTSSAEPAVPEAAPDATTENAAPLASQTPFPAVEEAVAAATFGVAAPTPGSAPENESGESGAAHLAADSSSSAAEARPPEPTATEESADSTLHGESPPSGEAPADQESISAHDAATNANGHESKP